MLATGGLLVCIALLTLAAVAPVFRRDDPPPWTTRGWVGEVVTLAIVCTLAIGVGYLGAGAIATVQTGPDYLDLGLLGVVLLVAVVFGRRLSAWTRARGVESRVVVRPAHAPAVGQSGGVIAAAGPVAESASELPPPHKAA